MKNFLFLLLACFMVNHVYGSTKRYYKEVKIKVPLDHFSFSRNDTFQLRYLVNDTYWKIDNGPVFFYTGNEGSIDMFAAHTGFIWETAEEFQALIVFAEHRYYGQSLPFGNKSLSTPMYSGYLTTSQALADYVDVIAHLKSTLQVDHIKNPIISFGGSYGGMLAAYFRIKYPHLITGAIAASAPVHQFEDMIPCDASSRIITSAFNDTHKSCVENIKKSWIALRNITKTAEGKAWLSKEWNLCNALKNETGIQTLIDYLSDNYFTLAMVNYPYENDFINSLPPNPVRAFCRYLKIENFDDKLLLQSLYKGVDMFSNYTGVNKCLDYEGSNYNPLLGDDGWDFQSCSEMVMPACSNGDTDMFEKKIWDKKEYSEKCNSKWGVTPNFDIAAEEYGGSHLEAASNIVFSNGLLDPWAAGGILRNISQSVCAIIIPEGAHHLDLMGSNPSDPTSVQLARKYHKQSIRLWIGQKAL